jgi:hypothetical protein
LNTTEAPNNARGEFPDDYYTFTVTAKDQAGNSGTKNQWVLLDNWEQGLARFDRGDGKLDLGGSQFTANSPVPIWLYNKTALLLGGEKLSDIAYLLTVGYTDADGDLLPQIVTVPQWAWDSGFLLIGDYAGGDGIYQPRLDGLSFSNISIQQRPGGGSRSGVAGALAGVSIDGFSLLAGPAEPALFAPDPPARPARVPVAESPAAP